MKKSEPKLILNLQVDSEELDQKVKLAMDKYISRSMEFKSKNQR